MISTLLNLVWLFIGTKVINVSTGPVGKTYLKVIHNWSVCVISRVESPVIEKYRDSCTSFTIVFISLFAIILISSLQILCDKYDVLPWSLFSYFSIWFAKNGTYLLRSSIKPRKFPLWNEPIISSCHVMPNLVNLETQWHQSYAKVLHANIYSTAQWFASTGNRSSKKFCWEQQHQRRLLGAIAICCVCQYLASFPPVLNHLVNLLFCYCCCK